MKKITVYILFLLSFALTGNAQEDMTLEKAIRIALENNFQIKIAEQNIKIAENNNTWGMAGKYPTVDLNGSFNHVTINDNNPASFLNGTYISNSLGASVDAQWLVYGGGRVRILKDQFGTLVNQQKLLQSESAHNLIRSTVQAYYDVLFQQERLEVIKEQLRLSHDRLAYENVKREFGQSNAFNSLQFEQAIINDTTNYMSQQNIIEVAKRNLYTVLNQNITGDYNFPERLSVVPEAPDREKLRAVLDEENFTLRTLAILSDLNALNTQLEKTALKPTVSVGSTLGFSENYFKLFKDNPTTGEPLKGQFSNRINFGITASANWNLYDAGVRKTNIENAKLQEEITQLNFLEAKAQLYNQLDLLIENYKNQRQLLTFTEQQIEIAKQNIDMTLERFKAGQITSLDYRDVQLQLVNASLNRVNAIYNLLVTKTEMDWLVGSVENRE